MNNRFNKYFIILLVVLMLPICIDAQTYDNATSIAGSYLNRNDFKETYSKYLIGSTSASKYYSNDSTKFTLGGLISKNEFKITTKGYNNSYSYLYESYPFWTLTTEGDGRYVADSSDKTLSVTNTTPKVRVTEYVKSDVVISGLGTYSNPWIFAPQYKITINVNNSNYGYISEGGSKVYKKEFIVSSDSTSEFTVGAETGYEYLGTTCGYILNDIDVKNKTSNTIKITSVTRDLECSINFGEKPLEIELVQDDNNTKSQPEKLYVLSNKGWFSDNIATSLISQITSNPSRVGYTYKGYYTKRTLGVNNSDSCDGTWVINTDRKLNSTKSLLSTFSYGSKIYPCYVPNLFTVKYDKNDSLATGTMSDVTCTYNKDCNLTSNAFAKTGYTFDKWVGSNGVEYSNGGNAKNGVASGTLTLKASWNANKYTVTLNGNGATTQGSTSVQVTYDSAMPAITKPTRQYKVTFNYNGNGTSNTSSTVTYTFNGYYYNGTQYYNSSGASARTWNVTSNTALTANWSSDSITLPTPTRTGYTFTGWYTAASGGSKVGNGGASYTPTSTITLYAQWRANFDILNSYKCANVTKGSSPYSMNYTGNCEVINDGSGNWRVKFTSSGTLTLSAQKAVDVFLVGGGGGGGGAGLISDSYGGGGGGGGYITTAKNLSITTSSYTITVGAGGTGGAKGSAGKAGGNGGNGGSSSIVGTGINKSASGGYGGKGGSSSGCTGGAGGSGGGGGGRGYALYSKWNKRYENMDESGGTGGTNGSNGGTSSRGKFAGGAGSGSGNNYEFGESSGNSYSAGGAGGFGQGAYYPMYGDYGSSSGGSYGGGSSDASATWYGGGGGGGGFEGNGSGGGNCNAGGNGYQGIVIIRNKR